MINKKQLQELIDATVKLGLNTNDIQIAKEYFEHNEYGLTLEHISTQLYEYNIRISENFYQLIVNTAKEMKIKEERYLFLKELIES